MEALFAAFALIIFCSGVGVVISRNPIYSALWLVANLMAVAGVFAMLDAHFLAAVQIIVYAGAIMVLVLFVLMLLNLKVEQQNTWNKAYLALSALVGVGFLAVVVPIINDAFSSFTTPPGAGVEGTVKAMGAVLYTKYLFPFEAASILIMAAIVGSVMLAKRRYK